MRNFKEIQIGSTDAMEREKEMPLFKIGYLEEQIMKECGENSLKFIVRHVDIHSDEVFVLATSTAFNITYYSKVKNKGIVNLKKINDIRYINKFFEAVNEKLDDDGFFIGCAETKNLRKQRLLNKYPPGLNRIYYFFDFIIKRVFPKFFITKKIYFFLTRGQNRVITRAETLGRIYSCGFEIVDEAFIGNYFYFAARKKGEPAYDLNPTYGPLVKLRRVGRNGKMIRVYKLRTMHPFAEYLQDYIYNQNNLDRGGKFKDDFRVSSAGKFFRKFWIDELPMLINLLKGDMKLVGVRPLSQHYFSLYSKELQDLRVKHKPGLIPPFYADMPSNLEEIQESELRYLRAYEKNGFITDFRYLWKAIWNILFKKKRSQ